MSLLSKYEGEEFLVQLPVYNVAMGCCSKAGKWDIVLEVLQGALRHGHTPDVFSFSIAASVCTKNGQWRKTLELFDSLKERVDLNVFSYNAAISACEKVGVFFLVNVPRLKLALAFVFEFFIGL